MICSADPIQVHWSSSVPTSPSSCLRISVDPPPTGRCDVRVLEFSDKKNVLRLHHTLATQATPVLLLVSNNLVEQATAMLRDEDDLCLIDSPWALIEHRLCGLQKSAAKRLDELTALRSRKELIRYLGECCTEASTAQPVSVILLDLDHFKALNDQHGHAIGDGLLVECGRLLNEYASRSFFVARFSGEEFVLVSRLDQGATRRTAENICRSIAAHEFSSGISMTCSIGIGTAEAPSDVSDLLSQADDALYAAKAGGRDQVYTYDQLKAESSHAGEDVDVTGLENRARVFSERVTNLITRRSRSLIRGLKHDAETDPLTQIYNRRYLDSQLATELTTAQNRGCPLCVGLIDVDHFGQVNKVHGWPTGDVVLRQVSSLIQSNLRKTDWVGRYGGEEFCVVLVGASLEQSRVVLERLRAAVESASFQSTTGVRMTITISVGVVEFDGNSGNPPEPMELLDLASQRTLAAKNGGRNRVC